MFRCYPGNWINMKNHEVLSNFLSLINIKKAKGLSKVQEFENKFAKFTGTQHALSFPSCRSAMYFSLKALHLEKNDEVILPTWTFWADVEVVVLAGLKPVFADVDFFTRNINPEEIEKVISSKSKVILPVHLNGLACDMDRLKEISIKYNLRILEDCARACGCFYKNSRVGTTDIGAFSFGYGKTFYAYGGGVVTSNDQKFINALKKEKEVFRNFSKKELVTAMLKGNLLKYLHNPIIYKYTLFPMAYKYWIKRDKRYESMYKLKKPQYENIPKEFKINFSSIQAKTAIKQLDYIDNTNSKKRVLFELINEELKNCKGLQIPTDGPTWKHGSVHYPLWAQNAHGLQKHLMDKNIDATFESAENVSKLERFKIFSKTTYPTTEKLENHSLFIPLHPWFRIKDLKYIAQCIREFQENS